MITSTNHVPISAAPRYKTVTLQEASRGMFIDFEGMTGETPSLLGILVDGVFEQVVFDRGLDEAARAKAIRLSTFETEIQQLIRRCEDEGRLIFAFSGKEAKDICQATGIAIDNEYVDVLKLAKSWRRQCLPIEDKKVKDRRSRRRRSGKWVDSKDNSLVSFCKLAHIKPPVTYGIGRVTHRIRNVKEQLASKSDYHRITDGAKRKWTNLLMHNRFDCEGMRLLVDVVLQSQMHDQVHQGVSWTIRAPWY